MTDHRGEIARLRAENARLVALLESHGIAWQGPAPLPKPSATLSLSTNEKIALFGRLFRGRTDVYPVRWDKQGRQERILAGMCQRVASRCLRKASHQMQ